MQTTRNVSSIDSPQLAWGDGYSDTLSGNPGSAAHTFTTAGAYTIICTAFDGDTPGAPYSSPDGNSFTTSINIQVLEPAPAVQNVATINAVAGVPWAGNLATFTDADPNAQASSYTASVDYGDGTTPDTAAVTADPNGGFDITDAHTFPSAGGYSPSITLTDTSGNSVSITDSATVAAPISVSLSAADLPILDGQSFSGTIATVLNVSDDASDYSGQLLFNNGSYDLSFTPDGNGNLLAQVSSLSTSTSGNYPASLSVTDSVNGQTASASAAFTVIAQSPLTITGSQNILATVNVPWSGTVVTFTDSDYTDPSVFTAATDYGDGAGAQSDTVATDPSAGFDAVGSHTFTTGGSYTINTTVTDPGGQTASVPDNASVTLSSYTVSSDNVNATWSPGTSSVVVGTLSDSAGSASNPSNFYGTVSYDYGSYPITLTPIDDANFQPTGSYTLTADLPTSQSGSGQATLYISESAGGLSNSTSTNFSVTTSNPFDLNTSDQSLWLNQVGTTPLANIPGSMDPTAFTGTITVDGQTSALSFAQDMSPQYGNSDVLVSGWPTLAPGSYVATVNVSESYSPFFQQLDGSYNPNDSIITMSASFNVTINSAVVTIQQTNTTGYDEPYTGPIATITDTDSNTQASDFTASVLDDAGDPVAATITGGNGNFTVSVSNTTLFHGGNAGTPSLSVADTSGDSTQSTTSTPLGAGEPAPDPLPPLVVTPVQGPIYVFPYSGWEGTVAYVGGLVDSGVGVSGTVSIDNETIPTDGTGDATLPPLPPGTYGGTFTVNETANLDGGYYGSASASCDFTVISACPTPSNVLTVTATDFGAIAQQNWVGAVGTYVDNDPYAGQLTATINWGDGTPASPGIAAGGVVLGNHIYAAPGPYKTTVMVFDSDHNSGEGSAHASVTGAPDPPTSDPTLSVTSEQVTFDDSQGVLRDKGPGGYVSPEWSGTTGGGLNPNNADAARPTEGYPVSYLHGSSVDLSVSFQLATSDGSNLPQGTYAVTGYGDGPSGTTWYGEGTLSGSTLTADLGADSALPDTIANLDLGIEWSISFTPTNGGSDQSFNGPTTEDHVYVIGGAAPYAYESVLDIGCRTADGLAPSDSANVIAAIWGAFSGGAVQGAGQVPLIYWANDAATATNTAGLLQADNGECGAFADLLMDCLSCQGIANAQKIEVTSEYGPNSAMLIKNWAFAGNGTSGIGLFPYAPGEFTDLPGAAGQNNANPPGAFLNHFIVLLGGKYYDPSYGHGPYGGATDAAAHAAWEDASIDGFTEQFQDAAGQIVTLAKKNSPGVGSDGGNIETIFTPVPEQ